MDGKNFIRHINNKKKTGDGNHLLLQMENVNKDNGKLKEKIKQNSSCFLWLLLLLYTTYAIIVEVTTLRHSFLLLTVWHQLDIPSAVRSLSTWYF